MKIQNAFEILFIFALCFCRSVELVGKHYTTSNCQCQIKDVACRHW